MLEVETQPHPKNVYPLDCLLEAFLDEQAYRGNSAQTVEWYRKVFRLLEAEGVRNTAQLTREAVIRFIASARSRGLSGATVRNYDRALRVALNWMYHNGYLEHNPIKGLPRPKDKAEQVKPFTLDEVERILQAAKTTRCPLRDTALVLTLLDTGIRAGEACGLTLKDIDWREGLLRVVGKTGERTVPFGQRCKRALHAYLDRERRAPHPDVRHVFLASGNPFSPTVLNTTVTRLVRRAGIKRPKAGPHTLRHTFAVEFLRAGGDVFTLQRILGHRKLEITQGYVNLLTDDIRSAHRRFSPVDRLL